MTQAPHTVHDWWKFVAGRREREGGAGEAKQLLLGHDSAFLFPVFADSAVIILEIGLLLSKSN